MFELIFSESFLEGAIKDVIAKLERAGDLMDFIWSLHFRNARMIKRYFSNSDEAISYPQFISSRIEASDAVSLLKYLHVPHLSSRACRRRPSLVSRDDDVERKGRGMDDRN